MTTLVQLRETDLSEATRGMDYCSALDLIAVSCGNKVILLNSKDMSPFENISSQHGCPTLVCFGSADTCVPSRMLISDNNGPIDVFDLRSNSLLRSYLEHEAKVTGIDWYNSQSFISGSADGTVRFYDLSSPHSHNTLNLYSGICGAHVSPFSSNLVAFGTTTGKFYIYDMRNTSIPYLEVKGHTTTVSNARFLSSSELLTMAMGVDSTAKLWDLHKTVCTNIYEGTVHHKYFVGLDSYGDFFALGGEDSHVRIYHKKKSQSIASKRLCIQTAYICGCALMQESTDDDLHLIAIDNQGHLVYLKVDTRAARV